MKYDNKAFQEKYEAWKNGADYWKDIRGINLGGDSQVKEPTPEEQQQIDIQVQSILNSYDAGKDVGIASEITKPIPYDAPLDFEVPKFKGGKNDSNDSIGSFVRRLGPIVGQQLTRYGYGDTAYYNVMRQLAYESNYGRSNVARKQHNYGGVGWNGKTYTSYKTDADFVKDYVRLMHNRYGSALKAKSTQDYAKALKQKGYYQDSLANYSRNLRNMDSLVKAAYAHKKANPNAYNYAVNMADLEQDYEDAKNYSPIVINSPSVKQPATIRADVPTTLLGPSEEEIKAQQKQAIDAQRQKMYDAITTSTLPNVLNLLPQNNFGKDAYGQKFWQRRGRNLHFKDGKDDRIAGSNPLQQDKLNQGINLELGLPKNYFASHSFKDSDGFNYTLYDFYDAGQLDDVVAKPSEYDKRLFDVSKKMFPDKQVRDLIYQDILYKNDNSDYSFNDKLLNMVQLYKLSGSPSITNKSKSRYNIIRSNYIPYYNHINAYPGSLIAELAHAYQYNNSIKKPIITLDNKSIGGSDYKRKGSIEHQAHAVIEPNLENFIETGDKKYLKKAKADANKEYDRYGHLWWDKGKDPYLYPPTDYDFIQARDLGYQPGPDGHWPSRNYKTGRYLKSPVHPTLYKGIIADNSLGYYPYYKDGAIYTNTWKGNEPYTNLLESYIQYRSNKKKGVKK